MKYQKDMIPKEEPSRLEDLQYTTGEEHRAITTSFEKNVVACPKQKWRSVVDVSDCEKSDAVKSNIA